MSSTRFELPGASGQSAGFPASSVGEDLRAARERLGWGLKACADGLRIRLEYLQALEDGQFGSLPAPAYAAGFLRSYGKALGLDADELVRRFKLEAAQGGARTNLAFPVPAPERGWPTGAVVLLGALLVIGSYIGWYRLSGEGRLPPEVVPAIPSRLAPLAEQVVPPSIAPTAGARAMPARDIPEPGEAPQSSGISPSSAAAAIPLPPVPGAAPPAPIVQSSLVSPPATPAPAPEVSRLTLRATGDAWVQVRDRAGQVLLRKVLKAGESWDVPPQPGLLLNTGNAGKIGILLDGKQEIALSGAGIARRDLPLDVDLIQDGKLGAQVVLPKPKPKTVDPADAAYVPPGSN